MVDCATHIISAVRISFFSLLIIFSHSFSNIFDQSCLIKVTYFPNIFNNHSSSNFNNLSSHNHQNKNQNMMINDHTMKGFFQFLSKLSHQTTTSSNNLKIKSNFEFLSSQIDEDHETENNIKNSSSNKIIHQSSSKNNHNDDHDHQLEKQIDLLLSNQSIFQKHFISQQKQQFQNNLSSHSSFLNYFHLYEMDSFGKREKNEI